MVTKLINMNSCKQLVIAVALMAEKLFFCDKLCLIHQCAMNKVFETCGQCLEMDSFSNCNGSCE